MGLNKLCLGGSLKCTLHMGDTGCSVRPETKVELGSMFETAQSFTVYTTVYHNRLQITPQAFFILPENCAV